LDGEEMRTRAEMWPVLAAGACGSVCGAILVLRDIPYAAWLPEADPTPVAVQLLAGTLAGEVVASLVVYTAMLCLRRNAR
jgi:hypothetical protein